MKTKSLDNFEAVHELIKNNKLNLALTKLMHFSNGHIRKEFAWDANHAWYCIGDIHFKKGNFHLAKSAFKKSLKERQKDAQSLLAIANCYDALNLPRYAEKYLRIALKIRSDGKTNASIIINLGNSLIDLNRHKEALGFLRIVSKRDDEIGRVARKNLAFAREKLKKDEG